MRKLSDPARASLMAAARAELSASGFRFEPGWARTVSGSEEGMYGWVAMNYVLGALQTTATASGDRRATVGALDLGGSSLEATFGGASDGGGGGAEREREGDASGVQVSEVVLPGQRYTLQTHTLKRYGLNDAFDRSVAILLQKVRNSPLSLSLPLSLILCSMLPLVD